MLESLFEQSGFENEHYHQSDGDQPDDGDNYGVGDIAFFFHGY